MKSKYVRIHKKGGKQPPPFLGLVWGSGGRRFKSGHPDQYEYWDDFANGLLTDASCRENT